MGTTQEKIQLFREAALHSYSMVFFNRRPWFAWLLLGLTLLDPVAGLSGLFSVLIANGLAILLGFNESLIRNGDLGFNALLVGLGLGAYYDWNLSLFMLLFFAALITLFVSIILMGIFSKYGIPFLSLPFVLALWTVTLAARNFDALGVSQRGLYLLNELYAVGDNILVDAYQYLNQWSVPLPVKTYFRSLGAILFQYNLLTGIVLSIALLLYSRLAWMLSLLGFFSAFLFYQLIGADLSQLNYSYIGFNFILSAIAIGGIFLVASKWSWIWTLLLIPLLAIFTSSLANLLAPFQLASYALPFNVVVLSFLYVLKWRREQKHPEVTPYQTFSPEHNRYNYLSNRQRFRHLRQLAISLPAMGQWFVKQGHSGAVTHREAWRHAWDFVIHNPEGKECRSDCKHLQDYYCYGKPVIAPADGTVVEIIDFIPDNPIGETNLEQNWGNSLIIDHGYGLYSQLSHLQPDTFRVQKGQRVWKGQELARCGNSGRSPEPHLHFQLQTSPKVGAPTYKYPIALYLSKSEDSQGAFHFFDFPAEGEYVQNLQPLDLLKYAFYFAPGKRLQFEVSDGSLIHWECRADMQNNMYIECRESGARAYLQNNGYLHYFTAFQGDRKSLLYHFYLAHYKVPLNYYDGLKINDVFPLHQVMKTPGRWLQDFACPFFQLMQANYQLIYHAPEKGLEARQVRLSASVQLKRFRRKNELFSYRTFVQDYHIERFEIIRGSQKIIATWKEEEDGYTG